jgi:hypothetical protein
MVSPSLAGATIGCYRPRRTSSTRPRTMTGRRSPKILPPDALIIASFTEANQGERALRSRAVAEHLVM